MRLFRDQNFRLYIALYLERLYTSKLKKLYQTIFPNSYANICQNFDWQDHHP